MLPTWARVSHTLFQEKGLQESKANTVFWQVNILLSKHVRQCPRCNLLRECNYPMERFQNLSGYMIRGQIPKNEACRTHIGGLGRHTLNSKWIRRALTRGGKLGYESAKGYTSNYLIRNSRMASVIWAVLSLQSCRKSGE